MFRELIDLGHIFNLSQLELEFIEGNDRARALYEKMGYVATGKIEIINDRMTLVDYEK